MKNIYKIVFTIANLAFFNLNSSCNITFKQSCTMSTKISSVPIESLLSSADNIEVNGNKFELQALLSRNLTVTLNNDPNRPKCLNARIDVINKSKNLRLPISYKVENFWVIDEDKKVWETSLLSYDSQNTIDIGGGPEWPYANKLYSAVIKLKDEHGKTYFIKLEKIVLDIAI